MSVDLILAQLTIAGNGRDIGLLRDLVSDLRPRRADDTEQATRNLQALCHVLDANPVQALALRAYLERVICSRKLLHLLTDTGITPSIGFWSAVWHSVNYKWLPPMVRDDYFKDVFGEIFDRTDDHRWVCAVDDAVWTGVAQALGFNQREATSLRTRVLQELLGAIQVLSYRITAIGLEAELVRNYPAIEEFESPFLHQNAELNHYIGAYSAWLADHGTEREDSRHLDVLLTQCEEIVGKIRRASAVHGTSVSLTRLLLMLTQSIERLRTLLALLDVRQADQVTPVAVHLFKALVAADNRKHSLSDLVSANTELLALQVTEHASRTGEHYVANTRSEWFGMMRSAAGAGVIVGFMALLKVLSGTLSLAPFGHALLYSLIYALGFILVYMLHFTIATKQPAMTAALMALALDSGKRKLDDLTELAVRVLRSQFIAIAGNVALVIPVAYLIGWLWLPLTGHPLAALDQAQRLLHDLDPIHSLALPHAAIAGVCLFLAGLISGYYDNKAAYANIAGRLQQLKWLARLLGQARLARIANYVGDNLGALAGNFFFGVMLGTIGTFGIFFGLPLDIRHITFSSANFAFALAGLGNQLSAQQWMLSIAGLMLIGLTNLAVSFALALTVALRSRRVNLKQEWSMAGMLWRRFCFAPRDFFLPPTDPSPVPLASLIEDSGAHVDHTKTE
jgi:site-specific recombinase